MNDMVKNLLLWMIIAAILLTVFSNFNQSVKSEQLIYSEFIQEVRSGRVSEVDISGLTIIGKRDDGSQLITVRPSVNDPQLLEDLFNSNVDISGSAPEQQSIWTQLLVASFPIIIIIAVFMFFMRQMQ